VRMFNRRRPSRRSARADELVRRIGAATHPPRSDDRLDLQLRLRAEPGLSRRVLTIDVLASLLIIINSLQRTQTSRPLANLWMVCDYGPMGFAFRSVAESFTLNWSAWLCMVALVVGSRGSRSSG
jgi:hypothetical protein